MQTGIVRTFSKTSSSPLLAEQTHTQVCLTGVGLLLSHRVFTQHHTNLTSHYHMLAVVHAVSHTVNLTTFGGRWWIRCRSYLMAGCLAFVSAASTPSGKVRCLPCHQHAFCSPSSCPLAAICTTYSCCCQGRPCNPCLEPGKRAAL